MDTQEDLPGRHELPQPPQRGIHHRWLAATLVAVLCGLLGVAIVTQVRDTGSGDALDTARPADLLAVLDTLHQREASLRQEIASLEQSLATMEANGTNSGAALTEAKARLAALQIQVGTVPARGPGVTLNIEDAHGGVGPDVLLDQLQELRAAGAEAVQMSGGPGSGGPVRIGADSSITGRPGNIRVDGATLTAPYQVIAIGDPPTLAAALNIPGGVVDAVSRVGGVLTITQSPQVDVAALRETKAPQYARPGR